MKRFNCVNGCCNICITFYKKKKEIFKNKKERPKKSGIFITNNDMTKILLVQSREQFWGPPKGSLNTDETIEDGAIREVKEETGLIFNRGELGDIKLIKGKSFYFHKCIKEEQIYVQTHIENNDANGIGWFNIKCLEDMINSGTIKVNQHCRLLIKKILNINLPNNYKERILKTKFIVV